jgi:restriction system protein
MQDDLLAKVPRWEQLLFPCLEALKALRNSATKDEILDKVCELGKYSDDVQSVLSKFNRRTPALKLRVAFALTYLKRYDAVKESGNKIWTLTENGASLTRQDCGKIPAEVRKLWKKRKGDEARQSQPEIDMPDTNQEDEAAWRDELLSHLLRIKPDAFERLAVRLLREAGFKKVEVTAKGKDGGIDGTGILPVNLVTFTVLFQCKRYQGSVGASVIRDFRGAMTGRCDKGLVITTGTFSLDARKEATRDGAFSIDLIDGEALCDLLKEHELGVKTSVRQLEEVTVLPNWFDQL